MNYVLTVLCVSRGSSSPGRHARGWAQVNWERNESVPEVNSFTSFTQKIWSFERHVRERHNTIRLRLFTVVSGGDRKLTAWNAVRDVVEYPKYHVWPLGMNRISDRPFGPSSCLLKVSAKAEPPSPCICVVFFLAASKIFSISCCLNPHLPFCYIPSAFFLSSLPPSLLHRYSHSLANSVCPLLSTFPRDRVVTSL